MGFPGRPRKSNLARVNGRISQRVADLRERGLLPARNAIVYFIKTPRGVKIGYTENVSERVRRLRSTERCEPYLFGYIECESREQAQLLEKEAHAHFKSLDRWIDGEWFELRAGDVQTYLDAMQEKGWGRVGQVEQGLPIPTSSRLTFED